MQSSQQPPPPRRPTATPPSFTGGALASSAANPPPVVIPPPAPPLPAAATSAPIPILDGAPLEAWAVVPPPVVEGAAPPDVITFPRRETKQASEVLVDPLKPGDARGERIAVIPAYNELVIQPAADDDGDQPLALQPVSGPSREAILARLEGRDPNLHTVANPSYRGEQPAKEREPMVTISFRKMQFSLGAILIGTLALAVGITLSRVLITDPTTQVISFVLLMLFVVSVAAMQEFERYGALLAAQVLLILYICTLVSGWAMRN